MIGIKLLRLSSLNVCEELSLSLLNWKYSPVNLSFSQIPVLRNG